MTDCLGGMPTRPAPHRQTQIIASYWFPHKAQQPRQVQLSLAEFTVDSLMAWSAGLWP